MKIADGLRSLVKNPQDLLKPFDIVKIHPHIKELMQSCIEIAYNPQNALLIEEVRLKITYVLVYLHDYLNIGTWREVPEGYRQSFTAASFLKALLLLDFKNCTPKVETAKNALKIIDKGFLLGLPLSTHLNLLTDCATLLSNFINTLEHDKLSCVNEIRQRQEVVHCKLPVHSRLIDKIRCPSIESFQTNYFSIQKPVIIEACMTHWPAMTKWQDINYLLEIAGERTVPIEIGSSYSAENFSQKLMTLKEFITKYYLAEHEQGETTEIGYLAQHDLLTQIPQLLEDIRMPEYCCLSRIIRENEDPLVEEDPEINAWFGPKGTVSSLHTDRKDNFLCQVYGSKQIIMFAPCDSPYLYPHDGILSNTSQVDPLNPNLTKFPDFQMATMYSCLLKDGEMLYIPPKWWHHVTALSRSFSVNFWWE